MKVGDLVYVDYLRAYGIILSKEFSKAPPMTHRKIKVYTVIVEGKLKKARRFHLSPINTHTNEVKK